MCDSCLIKIYKTSAYSPECLSPEFWRKKAYCCNTTAVIRYKKLGKNIGIQQLDDKISGEALVKLFDEQKQKCRYCDVDLSNGVFQLDHIAPLSRDGTHDLKNIQFVCAFCNRAKYNMSDLEFKKTLRAYVNRVSQVIEREDKELLG